MSLRAIVSYDGTANDDDALALARVFGHAGVTLTLAYVRHSPLAEQARERLEEDEAHALLDRGAEALGDLPASIRVVMSPSTSEGLRRLAAELNAELIIFGSDYRTAPGHVAPGRSAQILLDGGSSAVAIAPAGYSTSTDHEITAIGLLGDSDDPAVARTVSALAEGLDADPVAASRHAELLVVGSRPEARESCVLLSARTANAVEDATAPVLVLARGAWLDPSLLTTA